MRNVRLIFRRWLNVGHSPADSAAISVSTNGNDWITLWGNPGQMLDSAWMEMNLDISEFAAYQPTVYLRWTMGPTSPILRYSGWNIDDLRIVSYDCHGYYDGDSNGDQMVNVADAVHLINYVFKGGAAPDPVEAGDANCDKNTDVADAVFLINYVFKGGARPCCL